MRIVDARIDGALRAIWYDEHDGEGPERACAASMSYPAHVIALETDTYWSFSSRAYGPDDVWPHAPPAGPRVERLAMRELAKGSFSPISEDVRLVLRDAASWEALWARHRGNETAPAVDFAAEMVVAVVVHGPTGCGQMHLDEVVHDADARAVRATIAIEIPPENVRCFAAFEDVFHFVAVPVREGRAVFETIEIPHG